MRVTFWPRYRVWFINPFKFYHIFLKKQKNRRFSVTFYHKFVSECCYTAENAIELDFFFLRFRSARLIRPYYFQS